jgi:hypothetical protein
MLRTPSLLTRALKALGAHSRASASDVGGGRDSLRNNEPIHGLDERARALARWEDDGGRSARVASKPDTVKVDPRTDSKPSRS